VTRRARKRSLLGFEHRSQPLLPRGEFYKRLAWSGLVAGGIILVSLAGGVIGYHVIAGQRWVVALLNASMILGGMGPVDPLPNDAARFFASGYALYSGVALISSVGVFLAPAVHRLLHHFHLEVEESS
jgi:hypothetical protein